MLGNTNTRVIFCGGWGNRVSCANTLGLLVTGRPERQFVHSTFKLCDFKKRRLNGYTRYAG